MIETLAAPSGVLLLVCRIAGGTYAIDASDVERIVRMPALTPLPGAPAGVAGSVNVAGSSLPVVDPRIPLQLPSTEIQPEQHLIIISAIHRFALWVDRVLEAAVLTSADLEQAPAATSALAPNIAHLRQDCVPVLDTSVLAGSAHLDFGQVNR